LKKTNPTYWFVYITFFMVVITATFFDKSYLLYVKPIASLSLSLLYIKSVSKINLLFPLSIAVLLVTTTLINMDFLKYFKIIAVLISMFFLLCTLLLRKFISIKYLIFKKLFSLPVLISCVLVLYLFYSIVQLTLPVIGDSLGFVLFTLLNLLVFSGFCLVIYVMDRYEKTIYLFVSASSTILVFLLIAINELYYFNKAFTILFNAFEIVGLYFFASFFIETKVKKISGDELYF